MDNYLNAKSLRSLESQIISEEIDCSGQDGGRAGRKRGTRDLWSQGESPNVSLGQKGDETANTVISAFGRLRQEDKGVV